MKITIFLKIYYLKKSKGSGGAFIAIWAMAILRQSKKKISKTLISFRH